MSDRLLHARLFPDPHFTRYMATRDRTSLFLRYRADATRLHGPSNTANRDKPDDGAHSFGNVRSRSGINASTTPVIRARTGTPEPDYVLLARDLVDDVQEARAALNALSELYARHLRPSFGPTDHAELERDIRHSAAGLTACLHTAEVKVKKLCSTGKNWDNSLAVEEQKIRRNIQKRFAAQLQELSLTFRNKQKDYLAELRSQSEALAPRHNVQANRRPSQHEVLIDLREDVSTVSHRGNGEQLKSSSSFAADTGADASLVDQVMTTTRAEDSVAIAEERHREITKIAANINDLAVIVKDLAGLVIDQGTILDRIDYNVEEVQATTKNAVQELRIADRRHRKRYAFWCILFLSIGCGVMFALLLLKWLS